jgi:hypothetical protein
MIGQFIYGALNGNDDDIFTKVFPKVAPQSALLPVVVFNVITSSNKETKGGEFTQTEYRFQVDVYADTYKETQEKILLVKNKLHFHPRGEYNGICVFSCTAGNYMEDYDSVSEVYRASIEFDLIINNL